MCRAHAKVKVQEPPRHVRLGASAIAGTASYPSLGHLGLHSWRRTERRQYALAGQHASHAQLPSHGCSSHGACDLFVLHHLPRLANLFVHDQQLFGTRVLLGVLGRARSRDGNRSAVAPAAGAAGPEVQQGLRCEDPAEQAAAQL